MKESKPLTSKPNLRLIENPDNEVLAQLRSDPQYDQIKHLLREIRQRSQKAREKNHPNKPPFPPAA